MRTQRFFSALNSTHTMRHYVTNVFTAWHFVCKTSSYLCSYYYTLLFIMYNFYVGVISISRCRVFWYGFKWMIEKQRVEGWKWKINNFFKVAIEFYFWRGELLVIMLCGWKATVFHWMCYHWFVFCNLLNVNELLLVTFNFHKFLCLTINSSWNPVRYL